MKNKILFTITGLFCVYFTIFSQEITGVVRSCDDSAISNQLITLVSENGEILAETSTNANGEYRFQVQRKAHSIIPVFEGDNDFLNGINTLDLIAIQRHFLGIQAFSEQCQIFAADLTFDHQVNVLDLLKLQRLILGLEFNEFHAYHFLPSSHFLSNAVPTYDFVLYKIGDAN